jgi:hypothetical protein
LIFLPKPEVAGGAVVVPNGDGPGVGFAVAPNPKPAEGAGAVVAPNPPKLGVVGAGFVGAPNPNPEVAVGAVVVAPNGDGVAVEEAPNGVEGFVPKADGVEAGAPNVEAEVPSCPFFDE